MLVPCMCAVNCERLTVICINGAPGEIRTPGPLLRRQLLYPTELQAQNTIVHSKYLTASSQESCIVVRQQGTVK